MKRWVLRIAIANSLVLVACLALLAGARASPADMPSLAPMLENVLPGVVNITVRGQMSKEDKELLSDPDLRQFFGLPNHAEPDELEFETNGSGVIVDAQDGYVLTNNHLLKNAEDITLTLLDGRIVEGKAVGKDEATDLAVLRIDADRLTALRFGDSGGLRVGDYVVAIGNPFGLGHTVTMGIVSALGRSGLGMDGYEDFIQTDASINPGNSGGALVNLSGEVVGINSALLGDSGENVGIGFAIPINMARTVMQELIAHGEVRRGQLGVVFEELTIPRARELKLNLRQGAYVAEVIAGGAAEKAGLRTGDLITEIDGVAVASAAALRSRLAVLHIGDTVRLTFMRDGVASRVAATLGRIGTSQLLDETSRMQCVAVVVRHRTSGIAPQQSVA